MFFHSEKGNLLSSDSKHLENILREIEERQADVDRGGSDQDHLQGEFTKRMEFLDQECAKQNDILQTEERLVHINSFSLYIFQEPNDNKQILIFGLKWFVCVIVV